MKKNKKNCNKKISKNLKNKKQKNQLANLKLKLIQMTVIWTIQMIHSMIQIMMKISQNQKPKPEIINLKKKIRNQMKKQLIKKLKKKM